MAGRTLAHENVDPAGTIGTIDGIVTGHQAGEVLAAALELGAFDWLEKNGPAGRKKVAKALGVHDMFVKSFLQALADMGLVSRDADKYRNTELASAYLSHASGRYQGDYVLHSLGKDSAWGTLRATITSKDPPSSMREKGTISPQSRIQRSLRGELKAVVEAARGWSGAPGASTLMSAGDDHGVFAVAICREMPGLRADVLETPEALKATRGYIRACGAGGRIKVREGDIFSDVPGCYDIVVASHLLYRYREDLPCAIYRLSQYLRPGGLFLSDHWFCSPGCEVAQGVRELDKGLACLGHPLCGVEEFPGALADAGLEPAGVVDAPGPFGASKLHLAIKGKRKRPPRKKGGDCGCGHDG